MNPSFRPMRPMFFPTLGGTSAFSASPPPWETLNILNITEGMEAGSTMDLRIRLGCLKTNWQVDRVDFANNRTFVFSQSRGPFRHWKHTQSIRSLGDDTSSLRDLIQFSLPFGHFSNNRLGNYLARKRLERLFSYRHSITQSDMRHCTQMKTFPKTKGCHNRREWIDRFRTGRLSSGPGASRDHPFAVGQEPDMGEFPQSNGILGRRRRTGKNWRVSIVGYTWPARTLLPAGGPPRKCDPCGAVGWKALDSWRKDSKKCPILPRCLLELPA